MPRRLFDGLDQGFGEEIFLLENIPSLQENRFCCAFGWAVQRAINILGQPISYCQAMGRTGAAFMLPYEEPLRANWQSARVDRFAQSAFAELGWQTLKKENLSGQEVRRYCQQELQAQRPVLLHTPQMDWTIVAGLRGDDLLCERLPGERCLLPSAQQQDATLLIFHSHGEVAETAVLCQNVLARSEEILSEAQAGWMAWAEALNSPQPYGFGEKCAELFAQEQRLVACVAEARDMAAEFLAQLAEEAEFELAERLNQASEIAEKIVGALEQLTAPPDFISVRDIVQDEVWLEQHREQLHALKSMEQELGEVLKTARRLWQS